MKLIPISEEEMDVIKRKSYNKLNKIIEEFVKSSNEVVKVKYKEGEYTSRDSCANSLRRAAKRMGYYSIKIIKRGSDIYLSK